MKYLDSIYNFLFVKEKPPKDFSVLVNGPIETRPITGDLILVGHDALVSDAIEKFSKSEISHAAIYVGGGERKIIEATGNGVVLNKLDNYFKKEYRIIVRRINKLSVKDAEIMKDYAYSRVGKPYDTWQLFSYGFYYFLQKFGFKDPKVVIDNENKDICSELYNDAAKKVNRILVKKKKNADPSPQDLLVATTMKTVIEV